MTRAPRGTYSGSGSGSPSAPGFESGRDSRHATSRRIHGKIRLWSGNPSIAATDHLYPRSFPAKRVLNELQLFQLNSVSTDLRKIVLRLLNQPAFCTAAENLGQAHGHFRRYAALFVH